MTGDELKAARKALGLSVYELADRLKLAGDTEGGGDYVRRMERGVKPISGPIQVAVESFLREAAKA